MILTQFVAVARRVLGAALRVPLSMLLAPMLSIATVSTASAQKVPVAPRWISVPNASGHLTAKDIGVVINTSDPYSVQVGERYIAARGLQPSQVLRIELPVVTSLPWADFVRLQTAVASSFDDRIQALALAWKMPSELACNSITSALTLGYDAEQCSNSCKPGKLSPYFNSGSSHPFKDLHLRPSMLLAARDAAGAIAMIDRGVRSDRSLGLRGGIPANAWYVRTSDTVRSVRATLFPPPGFVRQIGLDVHVVQADSLDAPKRVLLYETGQVSVPKLDEIDWVPGALADHLTSFGGVLDGGLGQMSSLDWIASGATATYGTVSEPCAHPQKFPHPQILLLHYVQGESAIEAYWKSVAWPAQGVFIGEPLAAPYSR